MDTAFNVVGGMVMAERILELIVGGVFVGDTQREELQNGPTD